MAFRYPSALRTPAILRRILPGKLPRVYRQMRCEAIAHEGNMSNHAMCTSLATVATL